MDKNKLKARLISLEQQTIDKAEVNYEQYLSANIIDDTDVIGEDEQSHRAESIDLSEELEHQIHEHEGHLRTIRDLDFGPAETVRPGAVVKANNRYMFVGISHPRFKFDGMDFISISTQAPIYQCMEGKKKGDVCSFNDIAFEIQEVY